MKTLEQWDIDITQENLVIKSGMDKFEANIQNLGQVMGKDPTAVHDILKNQWTAINAEYSGLVYRNVTNLEYISLKLDKIIAVLTEIMASIDDMERVKSSADPGVDPQVVGAQIGEKFEAIAQDVEGYLSEQVNVNVPRNWIKMAMVGGGGYLVLRYIGLDKIWSLAAAAALAYWISTPKQIPGAEIQAQVAMAPDVGQIASEPTIIN